MPNNKEIREKRNYPKRDSDLSMRDIKPNMRYCKKCNIEYPEYGALLHYKLHKDEQN